MPLHQFSETELRQAAADAEDLMLDECEIHPSTPIPTGDAVDEWGYPEVTYPKTQVLPCTFTPSPGRESGQYAAQTVIADATVLLPHRANVDNIDRIVITKQYGRALTPPIAYNVISSPRPWLTGIELLLQTVAT